ncbi:HNH endonuclease [Arthrobacter sp. M-10]|uniref:HNH endonuclease n=1 Tax=Arthrobacter sp. M-10 TaxID=3233037 RepID=UPI003F8F4B96
MKDIILCQQCHKEFQCRKSRNKARKFCGLTCRNDSYVGGRCKRPIKYRDGYAVLTTAAGVEILISIEDADLAAYSWVGDSTRRHGAPHARFERKEQFIHRIIYSRMTGEPTPRSTYIDHINRNQLDNRRENLRPATPAQNVVNSGSRIGTTSPYKGVYRLTGDKKWKASIGCKGRQFWLGTFTEEREAAYMYDQFSLVLHGEFACSNVLSE